MASAGQKVVIVANDSVAHPSTTACTGYHYQDIYLEAPVPS